MSNSNFLSNHFKNKSSSSSSSNGINHCDPFKFWIAHQNVRSLRKNSDYIFAHFASYETLPDIIFCSEVWISSSEINAYYLDNYTVVDCCNNNYKAGGIVAYVSSNFSFTSNIVHLSTADVLSINLRIDSEAVCVVCVYRFHFCTVVDFIFEFTDFLQNIHARNLIVTGDFNINILQSGSSSDSVNNYLSMMSSFGLMSYMDVPTRITDSSSTCIDHVFARTNPNSSFCFIAEALNYNLSDHHFISIKISSSPNKADASRNNCSFDFIDFLKLNALLVQDQWTFLLVDNPSEAMQMFVTHLHQLIVNCSSKQIIIKKNKKLKPWMTNGLLKIIKHKNELIHIRHKHPNNKNLNDRIKRLQTKILTDIKDTKNKFYSHKFNHAKKDIKSQWNLINSILGRKSLENAITGIKDPNGNLITDPSDIAELFNKFFVDAPVLLRSTVGGNSNVCASGINMTHGPVADNSFFFTPISPSEVLSYINCLNNSHNSAFDGISSYVIKQIGHNIAFLLAHIFNRSIELGVFPDCLKIALVLPLYKKGNLSDPNNYRPISLLSNFSKIFEKCIKARLLLFLNKNDFFSNCQYGFREGLSTESALDNLMSDILLALNKNESASVNFIDLTKAFDTVDYDLLLLKLDKAGIRGLANTWFSSYLCDRRQIVKVSDSLSSSRSITCGVPQGSVLGPILFLVYINSIFGLDINGRMIGFADDIALSYRAKKQKNNYDTQHNIAAQMNQDLMIIRRWLDQHYMVLSTKTNIMDFNLSRICDSSSDVIYHSPSCATFLNNHALAAALSCSPECYKIPVVNDFKYLGITLDSRLNFKKHVENLQNYLYSCNRNLYMLRMLCPLSILTNVYYGLVQSKVQYGIAIWGGIYYTNLSSLIVAQKMTLRIMCKKNRLTSALPLFRSLGILPLRYLYIYRVLKMFFQRSGNRNVKITRFNLRNFDHCSFSANPKREHFTKFFIFTGPLLFNRLPRNLKSISNIRQFLSEVRVWLLGHDEVESLLRIIK